MAADSPASHEIQKNPYEWFLDVHEEHHNHQICHGTKSILAYLHLQVVEP
tara:strand:- start:269 stop:418 length:150 start_codon:yes stop_codon:yes gene_type:complete